MPKYKVTLTSDERDELEQLVSKGKGAALGVVKSWCVPPKHGDCWIGGLLHKCADSVPTGFLARRNNLHDRDHSVTADVTNGDHIIRRFVPDLLKGEYIP